MNKIPLPIFLFLLYALPFFGQEIQNASNIWYFGDRAGLDFNTSPPTALTDGQLDTQEGVATISDDNGDLLFYTDGITVWDRTHQAMPNANGTLNGHSSSTQSAVIVPNLGTPDVYYIFTTDELGNSNGLSYTSIDMSLPGNGSLGSPLGNVISGELNIQLVTPVTEKLTGVLKPDYSGYWIIAHGWGNNRFYAYEVNCDGVNLTPVITATGNIHSGGTNSLNAVGYMKAPIDGQKLALVNRNNGTIDVYDFDNTSGIVSNEIEIVPNQSLIYGIEFSPSGDYLYIGGQSIVSRYNFSSGTLTNLTIDNPAAINSTNAVRALQLGPDENIYVSVRFRDYISVIYDPDGNAPGLTTNGIFLDPDGMGRNCRFGLPNIFFFDLFPPTNVALTGCPGDQLEYNNEFYSVGYNYIVNLTGANGCDSTVLLIIEEFDISNETLEVEACEGGFYDYNGTQIPAGSQQTFTYPDSNGCDSTETIVVNIIEPVEENMFVEACEGGFYVFEGIAVAAGTNEQIPVTDDDSCTTLINLFVEALPVDSMQISFINCGDTIFNYLGTDIAIGAEATFTLQNQYGCDSILTVAVLDESEEMVLEISLCEGEFYTLDGNDYPVGTDSIFYLMDQNGCDSIVHLIITPNPEVEFILNAIESCWNTNNGSIMVENITGGAAPYEFSLDGEQFFSQSNFDSLPSGNYYFVVRDANLCLFEQEITITEIPEFSITYAPPLISCDDDSILISIDLQNGNPEDMSWVWSNGATDNHIYASQPGTYSFELSNQCQTLTEDIEVQLAEYVKEQLIYIPNAFSPNFDGNNDFFQLFPASGVEVLSYEIQIFDRWGALVFKSTDIQNSWDGRFKEKVPNPGVYVWWLEAKVIACKRDFNIFREGDITILR